MCEILGNQMGNQHLGFVQYSYGQSMICMHMGNFVNMDHIHIISFWVDCKSGNIVTN